MKQVDREHADGSRRNAPASLLVRGAVPLIAVTLALVAGPTLLVWWLSGGPFRWSYTLIGGAISLGLLAAMGLTLGWAVGRMGRSRHRS